MREPAADAKLYGLLAEFSRAEDLVTAVRAVRAKGFCRLDAFSPFPIDDLTAALDVRDRRIPMLTIIGGAFGAIVGFFMQSQGNFAYPIDIGGRPLLALPAFMLITFELTVLGAVGFCIVGMLLLNHLPRLHHPLFEVPNFHLATRDKFFLVIFGDDPLFDRAATQSALEATRPVRIDAVAGTEAAD